jgi:microcystin-dependent protein/predicted nucleic-acid-binding Zn-ribbon protein
MGNGEDSGTWGTITNTNWNLIEAAVAGVTQITMANANYTLSNLNGTADEARAMVLSVGGTNSAIYQVIAPLVSKFYVVTNNTVGGYAITIGASTGAVITVPNNTTVQVYCDGTNFYSAQTSSAGNFLVNGTLTAAGETDTGNMTIGGTLGVTGTSTFTGAAALNGGGTSTTPTTGDNTTKVATTAFVQTALANATISGSIQMWPTASAPTGWLICDGSAVSRTTYATLYGVIGTTFGVGDGSTTFNLPNYQGRSPLGASTAYSLTTTGGSADAVVVSHTHTATVTDPGHNHVLPYTIPIYTIGGSSGPNNTFGIVSNPATTSNTTGVTVANSTTGSSGTGANLQPYLAINFIIKT